MKEQSGSTPTGLLKLVRILEDGFRRIREYSYPLEDVRMRQVFGRASAINKILIVSGEVIPDRIIIVQIKQYVGFTSVQLARRCASNWWKLAKAQKADAPTHDEQWLIDLLKRH